MAIFISFSGFASAATISNTGSNVHYTSASERFVNNWYISTSNDKKSSNIIFNGKTQFYISNRWITLMKFKINTKIVKISKTKIQLSVKGYRDGKLFISKSTITKNPKKHSSLWWAKKMAPVEINYWKSKI